MTETYIKALNLACRIHKDDRRKGKSTPYIAHLLSVSAMVMDDGGSQEEAIGALLHDTLEDHPELVTKEGLADEFGELVADIVQGCTDTPDDYRGGEKPSWKTRKEGYVNHLKKASEPVLRVAIADKLHNASELLADLEREGEITWNRFNVGRVDQEWYLDELLSVFEARMPDSVHFRSFSKTVQAIKSLGK